MYSKYIQQFLEDNDLQAGEKFYILGEDGEALNGKSNYYFKINPKDTPDILKCDGDKTCQNFVLLKLLTEKYKVKKPPFHPKKHETFYYVTVLGDIEKEDFYEEYTFHYLLCNLGKCYKTYEEAEKHVEEDIKSYKNMQNRIERS